MVISISQILKPDYIVDNLVAQSSSDAIRQITSQLKKNSEVSDIETFTQQILEREEVEPTCMGNHVAFPHARTDTVNSLTIAAGRSPEGIKFENCGEIVHLIFIIGTPKSRVKEYLAIVGALARLMKDDETRQALIQSPTAEAFWEILKLKETS